MSRFFINEKDINANSITITGDDVTHIKRVLRLNAGDSLTLCDGKGSDYSVKIEKVEGDRIITGIMSVERSSTEPPFEVTLFQGLPKSDKMELIIQKCVELGVNRVVPVSTGRTVVKLENAKDTQNKVNRWRRISLEAAKQCNRGAVPEIEMPVSFDKALELSAGSQLGIIPYEKERSGGLKKILTGDFQSISVFIGPEGGFTEEEIEKALLKGLKPVTLGPRILRTETAGPAVLSILMYALGDMG